MKTNTFFAFLENISPTTWKASAYHRLGTPDLDQLTVAIRYVSNEDSVERFIKFVSMFSHTRAEMAETVCNFLRAWYKH